MAILSIPGIVKYRAPSTIARNPTNAIIFSMA
jgi:hypothetical protein